MLGICGHSWALSDQWYLGAGGGVSWLQPNPIEPGLGIMDRQGIVATLLIGRDIDERSSAQFQIYSFGEATLQNSETVSYMGADASILYRFYDSRDRRLRREGFGVAIYGRFALGFLDRTTDQKLSDDAAINFGAGGGLEVFFNNVLSLRMETIYHDRDAASAGLALVARFGGTRTSRRARSVVPAPASLPNAAVDQPDPVATVPALAAPAVASIEPLPIGTPGVDDLDGDGVSNKVDSCPDSLLGYPVRDSGCALFSGVLSGIKFIDDSAELLPEGVKQLDYLLSLLLKYPAARIQLMAHTDNRGEVREQSILTRARLKTMGTYLVKQGVRANRLSLRSFGGTQPLYDNRELTGRKANNRVEVLEHPIQ